MKYNRFIFNIILIGLSTFNAHAKSDLQEVGDAILVKIYDNAKEAVVQDALFNSENNATKNASTAFKEALKAGIKNSSVSPHQVYDVLTETSLPRDVKKQIETMHTKVEDALNFQIVAEEPIQLHPIVPSESKALNKITIAPTNSSSTNEYIETSTAVKQDTLTTTTTEDPIIRISSTEEKQAAASSAPTFNAASLQPTAQPAQQSASISQASAAIAQLEAEEEEEEEDDDDEHEKSAKPIITAPAQPAAQPTSTTQSIVKK